MHGDVRGVGMKSRLILEEGGGGGGGMTEAVRLQMLVPTPLAPSGAHLGIKRFNLEMLGNSFSPK